MSSSRPTRSRVSSPYVGAPAIAVAESQNANAGRERQRTLDGWIEPPLPAPRPSFAEHGIERHGVVQNMAPLGTRPSSKMLKAVTARLENEGGPGRGARKAATSTVTTPGESTMTPEPFTQPLSIQQEERSETPDALTPVALMASEDMAPTPVRSRSPSTVPLAQSNGQGVPTLSKSPPLPTGRTTPSNPEIAPMSYSTPYAPQPASVAPSPYSTPAPYVPPPYLQTPTIPAPVHQSPYPPPSETHTPSSITPLVVPPLPMDEDGLPSINLELTDKIVETAVNEALDSQRWPTAYALRTLYDDHRKNKRIVRLIEAIYNGRGDHRDRQEFSIIMRKKKREGKENRTAEYYFNGDGCDPIPPQPQPLYSIYPALQQVLQIPTQPYKTPYSALPPTPAPAPAPAPAPSNASPAPRESQKDEAPSSTSALPRPDPDQHVDKRLKSSNDSPALTVNGGAEITMNGTKKSESPPATHALAATPARARAGSVASSSSSLSSVDEVILEQGVLSAGPSPARPVSSHTRPGSIGLGFLGAAPQREFVSPYTNANTFAAVVSSASNGLGVASGRREGAIVLNEAAANAQRPSTMATEATAAKPKSSLIQDTDTPRTSSDHHVNSSSSSTRNPASLNPEHNHDHAINNAEPNGEADHSNNLADNTSSNSMAPAALLSQESHSSSDSAPVVHVPAKFLKANKNNAYGPPLPENEEVRKRKREARDKSNRYVGREESFVRGMAGDSLAVQEPQSDSDEADADAAPPPKKQARIKLTVQKTGNRKTRNSHEEEPDSSPTTLGFRPSIAPGGSVNTSRAGTPLQPARPTRKAKTAGSGLRLKSSPVKKKGGTSAGLPKESRPRSPGAGAAGTEEPDNNDFCSGCGGNGDLVCCDGCVRSFHFKCVDPPMAPTAATDDDEPWFCNICQAKQIRPPPAWFWQNATPFEQMQFWLDQRNPSAYQLPGDIRGYFTDVNTGADGEYEEVKPPPAPKITKKNAEQFEIDYFRKKDFKGNPVLCYSCHKSASAPDRMIIPCSFCGLHWHLDCLPTPMAKEPNPLRQWRCPAHVDDLLATLPQFLGPAHRFRTIKGAPVEVPAHPRRFRNTGYIEIENDDTDVEEEPGFFEAREFGKVYKLPEKGIVMDFISKVKQQGGGFIPSRFSARAEHDEALKNRAHVWQTVTDSLSNHWNKSDLYQKQAALNLAAMATSTLEIAATGDINALVDALITEAPPAAVSLMGRGDASNIAGQGKLTKDERASLEAIQARIQGRLDADTGYNEVATNLTNGTTEDPDTTMSMSGDEEGH